MGAVDCARQELKRISYEDARGGSCVCQRWQKTLKEAVNEAMRDWVTNVRGTHYILAPPMGRIRIQ